MTCDIMFITSSWSPEGSSFMGQNEEKNLSLFFNATAPVQCCMKEKEIDLQEERDLLTRFLFNSTEKTRNDEPRLSYWRV